MKKSYVLEDKMTSLRVIALTVILYVLGYFLKVSVLLNNALENRIENEIIRLSASTFTGIVFSTALFLISFHKDKERTPYIIALSDAIILFLVFDVFKSKSYPEVFTQVFISVFMAFIGFNLISTFVAKYKQTQANVERTLSETQQSINENYQELIEIQERISELEQNRCKFCDQGYSSKNALNAHIGRCKENPKNKY